MLDYHGWLLCIAQWDVNLPIKVSHQRLPAAKLLVSQLDPGISQSCNLATVMAPLTIINFSSQ